MYFPSPFVTILILLYILLSAKNYFGELLSVLQSCHCGSADVND